MIQTQLISKRFFAQEYQDDQKFLQIEYTFTGNNEVGWTIFRQNKEILKVNNEYRLLKTLYCGICGTDLNRHYLPFPLPQITGHEIIGQEVEKLDNENEGLGQIYAVEINCSHFEPNEVSNVEKCSYCNGLDKSMYIQCPQRKTIGIDTLPGGFSPYVLAPLHCLIPVPSHIPLDIATLTEPFAAALKAVQTTPPQNNDKVAVVGPRKLGFSVLVALLCWRRKYSLSFEITAVVRSEFISNICQTLGVDKVLNTNVHQLPSHYFDIVYDTSGTPSGFESSLNLSKKIVHLKSTSGYEMCGVQRLTQMVVDEISLLPFSKENLQFKWDSELFCRTNPNIYVSPSVQKIQELILPNLSPQQRIHQMDHETAFQFLLDEKKRHSLVENSPHPTFDLAIISNIEKEFDHIIRPSPSEIVPLIRARGAILILPNDFSSNNLIQDTIWNRKLEIRTSRCGYFRSAIEVISENLDLMKVLKENTLTHIFPLSQINEAFDVAKDSIKSIKVFISAKYEKKIQ